VRVSATGGAGFSFDPAVLSFYFYIQRLSGFAVADGVVGGYAVLYDFNLRDVNFSQFRLTKLNFDVDVLKLLWLWLYIEVSSLKFLQKDAVKTLFRDTRFRAAGVLPNVSTS